MAGRRRSFRVVTYNVHKCRGLDRRVSPRRIVRVLEAIDADIIGLQEVVSLRGRKREDDQVRLIADELGYECEFGPVRTYRAGLYGNATLSRLPIRAVRTYDISLQERERRGCLRTDIEVFPGFILHVYNVHLGTDLAERERQADKLLGVEVLKRRSLRGPRIMLGDFNDWTQGLTTRLLSAHFSGEDIRTRLGTTRTYPGVLPLLYLDHIFYDSALRLESVRLFRSRATLIASDHLPIVADFSIPKAPAGPSVN